MDAQQFAYWLNGYVEMGGQPPTPEQWDMIKAHLALVFKKVTPPLKVEGGKNPLQEYLDKISDQKPINTPYVRPMMPDEFKWPQIGDSILPVTIC